MGEAVPISIGVCTPFGPCVPIQRQWVESVLAKGYDLVASRITSDNYQKRVMAFLAESLPSCDVCAPIGEDLVVQSGACIPRTVGLCAPWIELGSDDSKMADLSAKVLYQELAYAKFCGLTYVVVKGPKKQTHLAGYARALSRLLTLFPELNIVLHTTFTGGLSDDDFSAHPAWLLTWDIWDSVRVMCEYPQNLGLSLEVGRSQLPGSIISRWMCEPVMMMVFGESEAFLPNSKNYPVLTRHTQQLVRQFSALSPILLIKESSGKDLASGFNGGVDSCRIYLRNLISNTRPAIQHTSKSTFTDVDTGSSNFKYSHNDRIFDLYADVLEIPLQPLGKPLDNSVYEVFESDKTKYQLYFSAISGAIKDLCSIKNGLLGPSDALVIAVLGAGRGALVDEVMKVIEINQISSTRQICIYAVEKHAGPLAFLHARKIREPAWKPVIIVHEDMRTWVPEEPINLIVSELLGSFGDNELSPECLGELSSNAKVLAANGIVIPNSYTSYIAPIFCPQLWNKAKKLSDTGLEQPYVTCLRQVEILSEVQPAWSFSHVNNVTQISGPQCNRRHVQLRFLNENRSRVYGFSGYFEAVLYHGVTLSTLPASRTPNLNSWFPMYFPIKSPLEVLSDSTILINLWRELDENRCWYEWIIETRLGGQRLNTSTIHNCNGNVHSILLH